METAKVIYNGLPPDEWEGKLPKRSSFAGAFSAAMQSKVLARWTTYGFKEVKP